MLHFYPKQSDRMNATEKIPLVRAYLEARMLYYLDILQQMVAINSFTANAQGVNTLAELTADVFATLGFEAELIPSENPRFGNHLVLTRRGRGARKIGFVSHLDTVFPPHEEAANDFRWRPEGERIYGPGTVDIKGGTVLMLMALEAIREADPATFEDVTWVLLLDASEETDGQDFGALCEERLAGPDTLGCFIFEGGYYDGTRAHVVVARKGMAIFEVEVEGKASHAGAAHQHGANAIVQLAEFVSQIATFTDYARELTFNVGVVHGGSVVNRVPHHAQALVEMRAYDTEAFGDGVAKMLALADDVTVRSANGDFVCRASVSVVRRTEPWPRNEATERLLAVWQRAGDMVGIDVRPEQRGGLSDGNYFWRTIPTLDALGPSGGNAHCSERNADGSKEQEYVSRDSFVPKALLNALGVLLLLNGEVS